MVCLSHGFGLEKRVGKLSCQFGADPCRFVVDPCADPKGTLSKLSLLLWINRLAFDDETPQLFPEHGALLDACAVFDSSLRISTSILDSHGAQQLKLPSRPFGSYPHLIRAPNIEDRPSKPPQPRSTRPPLTACEHVRLQPVSPPRSGRAGPLESESIDTARTSSVLPSHRGATAIPAGSCIRRPSPGTTILWRPIIHGWLRAASGLPLWCSYRSAVRAEPRFSVSGKSSHTNGRHVPRSW